MEDVEVPALGIVGVQVMGGGVTVLGEDHQGVEAYLLSQGAAPAGLLIIAVVIGIHLMVTVYHLAVAIVTTADHQPIVVVIANHPMPMEIDDRGVSDFQQEGCDFSAF